MSARRRDATRPSTVERNVVVQLSLCFADGAALYRAFLLREFSNENLEFWLACEEYKNAKPQKLAAKAQKIYNDFVAVQAPKEVGRSRQSLSETNRVTDRVLVVANR